MGTIDNIIDWGTRHWKLIAIACVIALLIVGPIN